MKYSRPELWIRSSIHRPSPNRTVVHNTDKLAGFNSFTENELRGVERDNALRLFLRFVFLCPSHPSCTGPARQGCCHAAGAEPASGAKRPRRGRMTASTLQVAPAAAHNSASDASM
jgi:hypothetical protein